MSTTDTIAIEKLITDAAERRASDLLCEVGLSPVAKIAGRLTVLGDSPLTPEFMQEMLTYLADVGHIELVKKDLVWALTFQNRLRLRVALLWERDYPKISLRLIPLAIPNLAELGYLPEIAKLLNLKKGLLLITGPQGSGKSTLTAALIQEMADKRTTYVVTVENPIEFLLPSSHSLIAQRQIGSDTSSLTTALLELRHEPVEIIMASEFTAENIFNLLELAQSGALVVAQMPAQSGVQALEEIIYEIPTAQQEHIRLMLSDNLAAVVCLRLLDKIGGGLAPAAELILNIDVVAGAIRDNRLRQIPSLIQTSREQGLLSLESQLTELVKGNIISPDIALLSTSDKESLKIKLRAGAEF